MWQPSRASAATTFGESPSSDMSTPWYSYSYTTLTRPAKIPSAHRSSTLLACPTSVVQSLCLVRTVQQAWNLLAGTYETRGRHWLVAITRCGQRDENEGEVKNVGEWSKVLIYIQHVGALMHLLNQRISINRSWT